MFYVFGLFAFSVNYVIDSVFVFKLFLIVISVNSFRLFLLYVEIYAKGSSLLCFFLGGVVVRSPYLFISVFGYPLWGEP